MESTLNFEKDRYSEQVLEFYQQKTMAPIVVRYGLYSSSIDRFLLVDSLDLWSMHYAAKLLSSKISTVLCIFSSEPPPFSNANCLNWTLKDRAPIVPRKQTPELHVIRNNIELQEEGPSGDFLDIPENLTKVQEFAQLALTTITAARLTELYLNSDTEFGNEDQSFYINLCSEENLDVNLTPARDKSGWAKGFVHEISKIIYKAQSAQELIAALNSLRSTEVYEFRRSQVKWYRQKYAQTFFMFLGWNSEQ